LYTIAFYFYPYIIDSDISYIDEGDFMKRLSMASIKAGLFLILFFGTMFTLKAVTYDVGYHEPKRLFFEFIPSVEGQLLGFSGCNFVVGENARCLSSWNIDYQYWHVEDGYEPDRGFTWMPFDNGGLLKVQQVNTFDDYTTWECANTGTIFSAKLYDPYDAGRKTTVGLPLRFHSGVTPGRAIAGVSEYIIDSIFMSGGMGGVMTLAKFYLSQPFKATIGNDIQYVNIVQDSNGWSIIENTNNRNIAINETANLVAYLTYENSVESVGHMLIIIFPYSRPGATKPTDAVIIQKAHTIPLPLSTVNRKLVIPYVN